MRIVAPESFFQFIRLPGVFFIVQQGGIDAPEYFLPAHAVQGKDDEVLRFSLTALPGGEDRT